MATPGGELVRVIAPPVAVRADGPFSNPKVLRATLGANELGGPPAWQPVQQLDSAAALLKLLSDASVEDEILVTAHAAHAAPRATSEGPPLLTNLHGMPVSDLIDAAEAASARVWLDVPFTVLTVGDVNSTLLDRLDRGNANSGAVTALAGALSALLHPPIDAAGDEALRQTWETLVSKYVVPGLPPKDRHWVPMGLGAACGGGRSTHSAAVLQRFGIAQVALPCALRAPLRVLVVSNGPEPPAVIRDLGGEIDALLRTALAKNRYPTGSIEFDVVCSYQAREGSDEPSLLPADPQRQYAAVILSGSLYNATDESPWIATLAEWVRTEADGKVPVLGVCFGHQLLAACLKTTSEDTGGAAGTMPEFVIGTNECTWSAAAAADPIVGSIVAAHGSTALVSDTHGQAALRLPSGAVSLGSTRADPNHVVRYRGGGGGEPFTYGCQYHPEYPPALLEALFRLDPDQPVAERESFAAGLKDTPVGRELLVRFIEAACLRWWSRV